jgi:arylsulfatase A-like enzyme
MGMFMQKMADMGLLDDTLLIVTADHGEEFWEHGSVGHGHSIFQELIHVPFIVFWKGVVPAGRLVDDNHDHGVVVPTIFDGLGLDAPNYLEGTSILPKAAGLDEAFPHAGFSTHQGERMAVWSGRMKLQMNGPLNTYLYDVEQDTASRSNLTSNHPVTLRYLRTLLGMFMGAPDKRGWKATKLLTENTVDAKAEDVQWDDELKQQLQKLGYVNE